jgi:hypothetical protein
MKRNKLLALAAGAISVACSGSESQQELTDGIIEPLNGQLTTGGALTRRASVLGSLSEAQRRSDTTNYYNTVGVLANGAATCPWDSAQAAALNCSPGSTGHTITGKLNTLAKFRSFYGFSASTEKVTHYYNRGDLGIGREMHCVDKMTTTAANGQVACYVRNFAAGDDFKEFSFGLNASNAYRNMATGNEFATVAMVYRDGVPAPGKNKVIFIVYGADPSTGGAGTGATLSNFAALDRHGLHHAVNCFPSAGANCNPNPVPGTNFNNHIPTNCLNCHGGTYGGTSDRSVTNALFLPFDLDQFEFQDAPANRTRAGQELVFRTQNEMARKVAARTGTPGNSLRAQLDGWYGNTPSGDPRLEKFEGNFNSNFVPRDGSTLSPRQDWDQNDTTRAVYRSVVRPYCRGCHVSSITTNLDLNFNRESTFRSLATLSASRLCGHIMPHALQTVREFWMSPAPNELDKYLRAVGQTGAADLLRTCNRENVVTLDPHLAAVASPIF